MHTEHSTHCAQLLFTSTITEWLQIFTLNHSKLRNQVWGSTRAPRLGEIGCCCDHREASAPPQPQHLDGVTASSNHQLLQHLARPQDGAAQLLLTLSTVLSSDPFQVLNGDREPQQRPTLLLKRCKAPKRAAQHRQRRISPLEVLHLSTHKSNLPNHKAFTAESKHGGAAGVTVLQGENTVFQH